MVARHPGHEGGGCRSRVCLGPPSIGVGFQSPSALDCLPLGVYCGGAGVGLHGIVARVVSNDATPRFLSKTTLWGGPWFPSSTGSYRELNLQL